MTVSLSSSSVTRKIFGSLLILALAAPVSWGQIPVGTQFTYQGQLKQGGTLADGTFDFEFKLFDDPDLGNQIGPTVTKEDLDVSAGLFTAEVDFGFGAFSGDARWLEICVRPGASTDVYTVLEPRQHLTAAPHALYSPESGFATSAGNADLLDGIDGSGFLQTSGGAISGDLSASGTISANAFELDGETITSWSESSRWQDDQTSLGWDRGPFPPIWYPGLVGIGVGPPAFQLHVADSLGTDQSSAVQVDFATITDFITTVGVDIQSETLDVGTGRGLQLGLRARTSINGPQIGNTEARIANSTGFFAAGTIAGVDANAFVGKLDNFDGTTTSTGVGGRFTGLPADGGVLDLDAEGTTWVGGVLGQVRGTINGTPSSGAVAGVIGIDEASGSAPSWAGYFQGSVKIDGDLDLTGACPNCFSDSRLKDSIVPLDGALERINALQGVRFRWREDSGIGTSSDLDQLGVLAQDVERVFPELVGTSSRGYKFVRYQKLIAPLIEAVKELAASNEELRGLVCLDHSEAESCR